MAGSNKKLQGFEALYRAEQEKQKPVEEVPAALRDEPPASKSKPRTKKESNKVSNITFSESQL